MPVRIANGEDSKYIQLQLGHASFQMTMDLYGHGLPRTDKKYEHGRDDVIFNVNHRVAESSHAEVSI